MREGAYTALNLEVEVPGGINISGKN